MSKFNKPSARSASGRGFVRAEESSSLRTYEGAPGHARDEKSDLFLLAVSNMVGESTFYESAGDRDSRYGQLVRSVAVADPAWTSGFLRWLRSEANMRSASLVGGLEAAHAMVSAGVPGSRAVVSSVLQRADEPGEALAYWRGHHGAAIPKPVKRGVADATIRLYNEYSTLKYDTASQGYRFADVLALTHVKGRDPVQRALFEWIMDRRYGRGADVPALLDMARANASLRDLAAKGDHTRLLSAEGLRDAGMTWEDALSLAGGMVDKARLWEALAPSMGYMALLRNLRNFDESGMSDTAAAMVVDRLADPLQVARSRQFPFRFLSAYEAAPSLRWGHALDQALQHSLRNLPALRGRTLILVDTSGSMTGTSLTARSKVTPAKAAAVFGVALAAKGEQVDLHGFATGVFAHKVPVGGSVIREVDRFLRRVGEVGHGTEIAGSLRRTYAGHDRVVLISDMQTMSDPWGNRVGDAIPAHVPLYGFNVGGHKVAAYASGGRARHEFGGLTDATFRMIPLLERGKDAPWPWLE